MNIESGQIYEGSSAYKYGGTPPVSRRLVIELLGTRVKWVFAGGTLIRSRNNCGGQHGVTDVKEFQQWAQRLVGQADVVVGGAPSMRG